MLLSLSIRDYVIVEQAELEFDSGFTALTGETGAGKSILVEALALILGDRAEAALVRAGAERAELAAEFDVARLGEAREWLSQSELGEDECLLRRVIDASGRSRAYVNGRSVTMQQLRELGEKLIEIHGQHAHQALLKPETQRNLLDAFAGCADLALEVRSAWREWRSAQQKRIEYETNAARLAEEREQVEWQIRELEALQFQPEEWKEIYASHSRLAHSAGLIEGAEMALDALSESEHACAAQLAASLSRLTALAEYDNALSEITALLQSSQNELTEAVYALRDYKERLELDPHELRRMEERMHAVHSAARKFRVAVDALPETLASLKARLEQLGGDNPLAALSGKEHEARSRFEEQARSLSALRAEAAAKLGTQVTQAMQKLAMSGGQFAAHLAPSPDGSAEGFEHVEFQVSAHKSLPLQPLAKVASGGELSRISLAMRTILSGVAQVPVMIFDEVDQGIGGRVAEILGRMLKTLGRGRQVFCVTHLPQVAASADRQWQVEKRAVNGAVHTQITLLDQSARVEEIARMLGGIKITETTRKHAREMLRQAEGGRR
jgi:DNA repair protein RecN (Recombination protein N)